MKFTWKNNEWLEGSKVPRTKNEFAEEYWMELISVILIGGYVALHYWLPIFLKGIRLWLAF